MKVNQRNWLKGPQRKPDGPREMTFWVSAGLLKRTATVLRQSGNKEQSHEGVAYWAGRRGGNDCVVTTCIAPAARTTYGSFDISSETNARVVMYLASAGLELLAQVHSHPGAAVGHSDGDDDRALMPYEGFLSIVVPHYGGRGMRPLTICGVHVFERGGFRRLASAEIEDRFRIFDEIVDLRK